MYEERGGRADVTGLVMLEDVAHVGQSIDSILWYKVL
jgi:hypothetical protein